MTQNKSELGPIPDINPHNGGVRTEGKAASKQYLGEFEEMILLAVMRLDENAYGVTIRRTIENVANRPTSIGAVYTTLERLEEKGFITSRQGESTEQRGGRAKRYFKIMATGKQALDEAESMRAKLRSTEARLQPARGGV